MKKKYIKLSDGDREDLSKDIQKLVQSHEGKVKLLINYNNILQKLKDYQHKTCESLTKTYQDQINGQINKLEREVQANEKSIQSTQEQVNETGKECRGLREKIRKCESKIEAIEKGEKYTKIAYKKLEANLTNQYKELGQEYNMKIDEYVVMSILREKDAYERNKIELNQKEKITNEKIKKLEKDRRPAEEWESVFPVRNAGGQPRRLPVFKELTRDK